MNTLGVCSSEAFQTERASSLGEKWLPIRVKQCKKILSVSTISNCRHTVSIQCFCMQLHVRLFTYMCMQLHIKFFTYMFFCVNIWLKQFDTKLFDSNG